MSGPRMIDPELPWGCWLRVEDHGRDGHVFVDDATGGRWPSLRAALWFGRFRMPDVGRGPDMVLLETMHAVLAACIRRSPSFREQQDDLFDGSEAFLRSLHLWLGREGLVTLREGDGAAAAITAEGMAVLRLLEATRPTDVRRSRPCQATIRALAELGLGPEEREERLARLEAEAVTWDAAFVRRGEAGAASIALVMRTDAPVPVRQTVWSLPFANADLRDRFHDWLCRRLDRWPAWSGLANEFGSERLTHHLLQVAAAAVADADESRFTID